MCRHRQLPITDDDINQRISKCKRNSNVEKCKKPRASEAQHSGSREQINTITALLKPEEEHKNDMDRKIMAHTRSDVLFCSVIEFEIMG